MAVIIKDWHHQRKSTMEVSGLDHHGTTKGVYASKRWQGMGVTESVRDDGSMQMTLRVRRKKPKSERNKGKYLTEAVCDDDSGRRRFISLVRESFDLDPCAPLTGHRTGRLEERGALMWRAVCKRDKGTRDLIAMINPAVLRDDDRQPLRAPLSGRNGKARVKKSKEKRMLRPGRWTDHVQTFTDQGMCSGPSKQTLTSESEDELENWAQCDRCHKWRRVDNQLTSDADFVCSHVKDHNCGTPEEPY
jgi:hypothetical protein